MHDDAPSDQPSSAPSRLPPTTPPADADAPPQDKPEESAKLDAAELADLCGALYGDVFAGLGSKYAGHPVELPIARQEKRGKQLGAALKALGWDDGQVILIVGLCAGAASDLALLQALKAEGPKGLPPPKEEKA
ncbi:MAG: hypothetical protein ACYC2H_09975 [Thermoplasmatota archaeon]